MVCDLPHTTDAGVWSVPLPPPPPSNLPLPSTPGNAGKSIIDGGLGVELDWGRAPGCTAIGSAVFTSGFRFFFCALAIVLVAGCCCCCCCCGCGCCCGWCCWRCCDCDCSGWCCWCWCCCCCCCCCRFFAFAGAAPPPLEASLLPLLDFRACPTPGFTLLCCFRSTFEPEPEELES